MEIIELEDAMTGEKFLLHILNRMEMTVGKIRSISDQKNLPNLNKDKINRKPLPPKQRLGKRSSDCMIREKKGGAEIKWWNNG